MRDSVTCVFVHGWAMNSAVWDECLSLLPDWIHAVVVDLPGHGTMNEVDADSLDDYVQTMAPLVHRPVLWVGWSLGGLAVLRLTELYPERVAAAMLIATNPCFVTKNNWSTAVEKDIFNQFAKDLNQHQKKTIRRFLALQAKGLPEIKKLVQQLQKSIQLRGNASTKALITGLNILLETDLRNNLSLIKCPLYWLLGSKDSLVPKSLSDVLMSTLQQENVNMYENSSHAPFISECDDFVDQLIVIAEKLRKS